MNSSKIGNLALLIQSLSIHFLNLSSNFTWLIAFLVIPTMNGLCGGLVCDKLTVRYSTMNNALQRQYLLNKPFSDAREGAIIASCTIDKFLKSVLNKSFEQLKFKIEKQPLRITCLGE